MGTRSTLAWIVPHQGDLPHQHTSITYPSLIYWVSARLDSAPPERSETTSICRPFHGCWAQNQRGKNQCGASSPGGGMRHTIQGANEALKETMSGPLAHGLSSTKATLSLSPNVELKKRCLLATGTVCTKSTKKNLHLPPIPLLIAPLPIVSETACHPDAISARNLYGFCLTLLCCCVLAFGLSGRVTRRGVVGAGAVRVL